MYAHSFHSDHLLQITNTLAGKRCLGSTLYDYLMFIFVFRLGLGLWADLCTSENASLYPPSLSLLLFSWTGIQRIQKPPSR